MSSIDQTKKYKSYRELAAAFASGELDPKKCFLFVDNDSTHLTYRDEPVSMAEADKLGEHYATLFQGNGHYDFGDALNALDIPWEPA